MIQVIKTKCCDSIFAACTEPECYTDVDWLKELREYSLKGCKIQMIEKGTLNFGRCTCLNQPKN